MFDHLTDEQHTEAALRNIRVARSLLSHPDKWVKGAYSSQRSAAQGMTCFCLYGALCSAAYGPDVDGSSLRRRLGNAIPGIRDVQAAAVATMDRTRERYSDMTDVDIRIREKTNPASLIMEFNDHASCSWLAVAGVLEMAENTINTRGRALREIDSINLWEVP